MTLPVNDDTFSRRTDEDRVPLAEAKATLTVNDVRIDATVMNVSNDGLAFWFPENPNLIVGSTIQVDLAGGTFPFNVKWIDEESKRGWVIGGDRDAETT